MALPAKPSRPLSIQEAHDALTAPGMALETVDATINGVNFKVWKNAVPTIRALWESTARFRDMGWEYLLHIAPDGSEQSKYSFKDAWEVVSTMGHTFLSPHASFGLPKGERVALMMRNRPESVVLAVFT